MAELFADLDTRLNARADYFEQREADPGFSGFHRLEYGLFAQQDTKASIPAAEQLLRDIGQLRERLHALTIPPERLAGAGARLLRRLADNLPSGGEDHYVHAEAANLQGTLDGTKKIADLLAPLLIKAAPGLNQAIAQHFDALATALAPYREGEGFKATALDEAQRQTLAAQVRALGDEFSQVNAALGLE